MCVPSYYAHSDERRAPTEWHRLNDHLNTVAALASQFAGAFESEEWGKLAGLWHDIGKYQEAFQRHIAGDAHRVDHAVVGGLLATFKHPELGLLLAFAIAGHHGGLPNLTSSDASGRPLRERMRARAPSLDSVLTVAPESLCEHSLPPLPPRLLRRPDMDRQDVARLARTSEFWVRFIFSALVDADYLDTEAFYRPGYRQRAVGPQRSVSELRRRLDGYVDKLSNEAQPTSVNEVRAQVLAACRSASDQAPGVFALPVPTGGGKTLSAMAFALRHAERHALRRVIVVIPYTSIIEQNAQRYRDALGPDNVVEHHSTLDPATETMRNRLASENWDAPVIVTTSVQFLESLFAHRPSRCRKLHNVARSVIVLDEVQTLPPGLLSPILEALQELTDNYGCSVVLSTATPPALAERPGSSFPGLKNVRSIIAEHDRLGAELRRVAIDWPDVAEPPIAWEELATRIGQHQRVLVVVHRRQDARQLAKLLPQEGRFHLSALMCPAHRSDVLEEVRNKLRAGRTCRLVSTQLVEAGVDIDFPVVYRALGGLDSIAQAAGRCNREGHLREGQMFVFRAPSAPPPGTATKALESTEAILRETEGAVNLADPKTFEAYFRSLYLREEIDAKGVQAEREQFSFANVASRFKLIEDGYSHPIVVPYRGVAERIGRLGREGPSRDNLRALQPFTVTIYEADIQRLEAAGALELVCGIAHVLTPAFHHLYTGEFGLVVLHN
jgi:CRISPR-associated endonuclease/helicase Cas3